MNRLEGPAIVPKSPITPGSTPITPKKTGNVQSISAVKSKKYKTVTIRRPHKDAWFRAHPSHSEVYSVYIDAGRTYHYVPDDVEGLISKFLRTCRLYLAREYDGSVILLPVNQPGPDGEENPWNQTAEEVIDLSKLRKTNS